MSNGFPLGLGSPFGSSRPKDGWPPGEPGQLAPFAPARLLAFVTTTGRSAPGLRIATRPLRVSATRGSRSRRPQVGRYRRSGSHVPRLSPSPVHATSAPDTIGTVCRLPPDFVPGQRPFPGFGAVCTLSTRLRLVHFRSSPWFSPDRLLAGPFPQRSPPRLLTGAACGGLEPPAAGRLQRVCLHLRRSFAPSVSFYSIPPCARGARSPA